MHIVIMAGGSGTRFWPRSRRATPKQFLTIAGAQPMLAQAVDNALGADAALDKLWIVAGDSHRQAIQKILPHLPAAQLLCEPCGRNTAPAIGYACVKVAARSADAVMAVLPSDHVIRRGQDFRACLQAAAEAAQTGAICTIGLRPTRPETGYGYIRVGATLLQHQGHEVCAVRAFVEKPALDVARTYLEAGDYLWNGGMFVFRVGVMLDAIRAHMPALAEGLDELAAAIGRDDEEQVLARVYPQLPSESIDFGVMEKVDQVAVVPADIGWSDVGSWAALPEVRPLDAQGNTLRGDVLNADSQGCVVEAEAGRVVALVGCRDLVVVDTPDAVLVMPRDRAQDVRLILDQLKKDGREDLL